KGRYPYVGNREYDFAGWVTKNDIKCSDGVTIKHNAFRDNHGQKVPLVWNHDYNSPNNVLGHVVLENQEKGVYGYGFFNDTDEAKNAKQLVQHSDISSMSIGASRLKRAGTDIVHGSIYEVSLVLAAANPGAMIETVITHSDKGDTEEGIIYPGTLIHSYDDLPQEEEELQHKDEEEKTIEDVINTMNEEQKEAVYALLGIVADGVVGAGEGEEEKDKKDEPGEEEKEKKEDDEIQHNDEEKGDEGDMKNNVFNQSQDGSNKDVLKHSINEALTQASNNKVSSLKDFLAAAEVKNDKGEVLQHGINS